VPALHDPGHTSLTARLLPSLAQIGVVALTMFDLRRRMKVDKLSMVGTTGSKFPGIREHFEKVRSRLASLLLAL
jgi:hypothetical protein